MSKQADKTPLPFIQNHRLIELVRKNPNATREEQRRWLLPETFRWRREDNRFREAPDDLSEGWAWEVVEDRTAFLADCEPRLRAITVNAGCGKTVAAWQTQYLRQRMHSDHLCLLVNFSRLPLRCGEFWNDDPLRSCLVNWFLESEATKEAPRGEATRLIAQKIQTGKFTLIVEAFDQTTAGKPVQDQAAALQKFLEINSTVRGVCTGRPHAIVDQFWQSLFQHDSWQFVQIDVFDKQQAKQFVGPERWQLCQKLDATELFVPRSLEAIRNIPAGRLRGIRTASQIYWRSLLHTFDQDRITQDANNFRSPDGSWEIKKHHALQLFALLGFECNRQGFLDGVRSGVPFRTFLDELWRRQREYLKEEYRIESKPALEETFTILARLNAAIDFAALDHEGITQVIFQNRTLQDFLAAIWICTHASGKDRQWFSQQRFVRWDKSRQTHYQMWKLAVEMPGESEGQMIARMDRAYVKAMRVLYNASTPGKSIVRSTEMIWRSWPVLEEIGHQENAVGSAARAALEAFQSEYRSLLKGSGGAAAQSICEEFESWFVLIDGTACAWHSGDKDVEKDVDGKTLPMVDHRYRMAKYPVTHELYRLFDSSLDRRYAEYSLGSIKKGELIAYGARGRAPVVAIDWYDAWCVSTWLGGCLPTEQEWEYACRAGSRARYSVGDGTTLTAEDARFGQAWSALAFEVDAYSVGNAWDLYQMHGNVWEWCANWTDAEETFRCLRGGSFNSDPENCRSADRFRYEPSISNHRTGVRVSRAAGD